MDRRTVVGALAGAAVTILTGTTADESGGRNGGTPASDGGDRDRSAGDASPVARSDPSGGRAEPDGDDRSGSAGGDERSDVAFELVPYEISECGLACREATATVTNVGSDDATGVRVVATLFAGDGPIWESEESVGRLEAGESVSRTERIEVDVGDALAIENDGSVIAETIVDSDQHAERIVREIPI